MSNFGTLLRQLRHDRGFSLNDLARKAGTQKGYLSGIENGKVNPPSAKLVRKFAELFAQDEKMLLRLAWADKAPSLIREEAVKMVHDASLDDTFSPNVVSVQLLNPDGSPYPTELEPDGSPRAIGSARLILPRSRPTPEFAAVVTDDSMQGPGMPCYRRGDVVLLARAKRLEHGAIALVLFRGVSEPRSLIRKVLPENRGGIVLKPLNDKYPLEFTETGDIRSMFKVVGRIEMFATGMTA